MVWVTGFRGMLGKDITLELESKSISYQGTDIELDITSSESVLEFVTQNKFDWIINCAAYTAVDLAEEEQEKAYAINSSALVNLVNAAVINNTRLIHFSTDYVFNGKNKYGYSEDDPTGPEGVYGASKLSGEKIIIENYNRYFIFRISWLYGLYGKNFVSTMLNLFKERNELNIVNDQYGSPTYTSELASFIIDLIKNDSEKYGIYHFSSEGITTWYRFACEIYSLALKSRFIDKEIKINPIDSSQYPTKAKRPEYSYLLKNKLFNSFGYKPKQWQRSLKEFINSLEVK